MFRLLFRDVILPILLFTLVRAVIRSLFRSVKGGATPPRPGPSQTPVVQAGGELKKDPVCGIYVSTAVSISRNIDGELVYFCSKECRDKYH